MNKEDEFYIEDVVATGRRQSEVVDVFVGDSVKIVLRLLIPVDGIDAERLWFRVLTINENSLLVELDNDPLYIKSLGYNASLTIERRNILEVLK